MKKRIIFVLLAVLTVSFAATGFAAKKAAVTKKETAKPAATVNPLIGTWSFSSMYDTTVYITFNADTVIFKTREGERGETLKVEMKYKFTKSPVILEYKDAKGKPAKLSLKYSIKGSKLTYRFLNTKNKPVPGLTWQFSMDKKSRTSDPKDADIVAEKEGREAEEISPMGGENNGMTSDKPAETGNPLLGTWNFSKFMNEGEITFNANDVDVKITPEGGKPFVIKMKYKYSKSPLTLEYKNPKGKTAKLKMEYKVEGGVLTYSIPDQNNKPVPGFPWAFSQRKIQMEGIEKISDWETRAEKK